MTGYRAGYTANTSTAGPGDWRSRGVCRDEDPETFFPIGVTGPALLQVEEAKAVCRRCPVITACLSWALNVGEDAGVWGGMSEAERRQLRRKNASTDRMWLALRAHQATEPAVGRVRELAAAGCTDAEIAALIGLKRGKVSDLRARHGIESGWAVRRRATAGERAA